MLGLVTFDKGLSSFGSKAACSLNVDEINFSLRCTLTKLNQLVTYIQVLQRRQLPAAPNMSWTFCKL